jgi:hypothetical protein
MDDELERRLRAAREGMPGPSATATRRARDAVLSGSASDQGRLIRAGRRRLVAVFATGAVTALAAAFFAGFAVAAARDLPPGGDGEGLITGPGFLPAPGWDVFETGTTEPPQAPTATASNVSLDPADEVGGLPHPTLERLGPEGIVIFATFYPSGESEEVDRQFPERSLPLRLSSAEPGGIEGQPENVSALRLLGRVGDYNIDVVIFIGSADASPSTLELADEQLGRLVVPE